MQMADGTWCSANGFMARLVIPGLHFDEWFKVFGVKMKNPSSRVLLGRTFLSRYHVTYNGPQELFHWFHAGPPMFEEHDG